MAVVLDYRAPLVVDGDPAQARAALGGYGMIARLGDDANGYGCGAAPCLTGPACWVACC